MSKYLSIVVAIKLSSDRRLHWKQQHKMLQISRVSPDCFRPRKKTLIYPSLLHLESAKTFNLKFFNGSRIPSKVLQTSSASRTKRRLLSNTTFHHLRLLNSFERVSMLVVTPESFTSWPSLVLAAQSWALRLKLQTCAHHVCDQLHFWHIIVTSKPSFANVVWWTYYHFLVPLWTRTTERALMCKRQSKLTLNSTWNWCYWLWLFFSPYLISSRNRNRISFP